MWIHRHPIRVWSLAWAVSGTALLASAALAFLGSEDIALSLGWAVGCGSCGALAAKLASAGDRAFTRTADGPGFALGRTQ